MTQQQKTDLLFKLWHQSGMTKTEFAERCGWKNSSNLCRMISGQIKTTYEHIEKVCEVLGLTFKIEVYGLENKK